MTSPAATDYRSRLISVLNNCVAEAVLLRQSLEDERRALESQDLDALHAAADKKTRSVQRLQTLETERRRLCVESGVSDHNGDMGALAAANVGIAEGWNRLMSVVSECNQLNATNGAVISLRRNQFETSLTVLRGGSADTEFYGRDGKGTNDAGQQSLAEV